MSDKEEYERVAFDDVKLEIKKIAYGERGKWLELFRSVEVGKAVIMTVKDVNEVQKMRVAIGDARKSHDDIKDIMVSGRKQADGTYKVYIYHKSDLNKKDV